MQEKIYRFALIGCGRFGKNYIKTIAGMDNVQITHLVTSKPENAKLIANKVKIFKTYGELLSMPHVDGVIIATPPETHSIILQDCIYHLLPALVEKPLCMSLKEANALRDYVKTSKVPVMVGHTQLYNPAYVEFCSRFKSQKPKTIQSKVSSFGPFRDKTPMLWDWAPHDLSMCLNLLKEMPTKVSAVQTSHANYPNSGQLEINLEFKATKANIYINNLSANKYRAFVGTSSFQTMSMFDEELYEGRSDRIFQIQVPKERPLKCVVDAFVEAIETSQGGNEVWVGLDLAVDITKVIEKCQRSIEKNGEYIVD